jgi:hypothetical protein
MNSLDLPKFFCGLAISALLCGVGTAAVLNYFGVLFQ